MTNLGLLLSPGDSLSKQKQSGQLDRLIKYYLSAYAKVFDYIYLFSYGDVGQTFSLPKNVVLLPKPKLIPNYFYQLLLPLIHKNIIKQIDIFRVFQAPGGLPAVISKKLYKKPYVVSQNYDYVNFARVEHQPLLAFALKLVLPFILKYADKIITPQLIPNGVDPQIFKPNYKARQPYLVLAIGRLRLQKNFAKLIQVISASYYRSKINLVIIGVGPQQQLLTHLATKLNVNLKLIPNISHPELITWYQQASIFALTSRLEGQPKVLLEAMSSACPCLTTNFDGNLILDEETGLVGQSIDQLTTKLDQLLSDPDLGLKLGTKARQLIINRFDLNKLVAQEIKILQLCAKK